MTKEQVEQRIAELEEIKGTKTDLVSGLRVQLGTKQAEVLEIQRQVTENTWENTDEFKEYTELKTALTVLNR